MWDLADLIRAGWITVTAFDPKYIELRALAGIGLGSVHSDVPTMPDRLEELVAELDVRCQRMTGRKHTPSLAEPVRLVVIDELATLTALADSPDATGLLPRQGAQAVPPGLRRPPGPGLPQVDRRRTCATTGTTASTTSPPS